MNNSLLIFEYSPWFILLCLLTGVVYAYLLYNKKSPWSVKTNYFLASLRFLLVSILAFLLIGPILKQVRNTTEDPILIFSIDNSSSIIEITDSSSLDEFMEELGTIKNELEEDDFRTFYKTFSSKEPPENFTQVRFEYQKTDINGMLREIQNDYEGRNLAGVVLVSDGIYNLGMSPNFSAFNFDIFTVGLGDTIPRKDVSIKNLYYNKISYQGNQFPLITEIIHEGYPDQVATVSVRKDDKILESKTINLEASGSMKQVEFLLDAEEEGMQRYVVEVNRLEDELTYKNNIKQAYIDIVEGKEKILLVAPAPHPDIKAITGAIESNQNYELTLFIPDVYKTSRQLLDQEKFDLVIFHQVPDRRRRLLDVYQKYLNENVSTLTIIGPQTDLRIFNSLSSITATEPSVFQPDNVSAVFNPGFSHFDLSEELRQLFSDSPPVTVPFGKVEFKRELEPLLYRRVGKVETNNPLLVVSTAGQKKQAVLFGVGTWRWRLHNFMKNENNQAFNEFYSKLVQFLSSKEDKRKFKVYPVDNEVSSVDGVVFETELYNDLYERIYGNKIDLVITDEEGNSIPHTFVPVEGNTRYRVENLRDGVYQYKASTSYNNKQYFAGGEFLVKELQLENVNLTADFALLRKLARNTGGSFYKPDELHQLQDDLESRAYPGIIHSNEEYLSLINLKILFFLLLTFASLEWFARKYSGSY